MLSKPLTLILVLALTLAIGLLLVWPLYQDYQEVKFKVKSKKVELENREAYFDNLQSLSDKLKKYQLEMNKVESGLPGYADFPSLLSFLKKAASDNGLVLGEISSIGISSEEGKAKKVEVEITVIGSYAAFKNFLLALEKSSRLIEVSSISLQEESSFKLKLSAHY